MHYRRFFCFVALTGALLLTTAATGQVVDFGKYPNFSGQWSRPAGNPNNWRQVAGPPPYTPESEKKFAEIQGHFQAGQPRQLALDFLYSDRHAGDDEPLQSDGDRHHPDHDLHSNEPQ